MTRWLIAVVVIFGFLSAPGQFSAAAAGKQVVIAHAAMNARVAPLWVARERGFFAKYGVEADTIFVRGAPTLVAAMQSNEIDVGYTGGTAVVGAVANGADLKVLSAFTNRVTYDLMVKPGIKRPEDLRGKKFGIQSIGGTVWMGAILALEHLKLDAERDKINIIAVGDQNVLAQALETGTIDATVLGRCAKPASERSGFSDARRFKQSQSADIELRLRHARTQYCRRTHSWRKI